MQTTQKILTLAGITLISTLVASQAHASRMTFTATKVLQVSDRHAPTEKLLQHPVRLDTEAKAMYLPKSAACVDGCHEQVVYSKLQLMKFQKMNGMVTLAVAKGSMTLDNGQNTASIEITGNTKTGVARFLITTVSPDGDHQSQALLEGYFTEALF